MNPILIAVCVIGAIGLLGGVLLVIGSKVFAVTKDERCPAPTAVPAAMWAVRHTPRRWPRARR